MFFVVLVYLHNLILAYETDEVEIKIERALPESGGS